MSIILCLKSDLSVRYKLDEELVEKKSSKLKQSKTMKEKIIQVAIKKFAKEGFANTSMDDVAKSSKVSKGLVFYHFHSKEELYLEALSKGIKSTLDFTNKLCEIQDAMLFQKRGNLFQDLEKYYDLVVTKREKELERLWLDGMLEAKKNPKLKKILIECEEELTKVGVGMLKAGRETTRLLEGHSDAELMEVARGLLALYKGVMLEKVIGKDPKEIKKLWVRIVYSVYMTSK